MIASKRATTLLSCGHSDSVAGTMRPVFITVNAVLYAFLLAVILVFIFLNVPPTIQSSCTSTQATNRTPDILSKYELPYPEIGAHSCFSLMQDLQVFGCSDLARYRCGVHLLRSSVISFLPEKIG
jgi:hypothetical protein